jgi:hypothetical protein
VFTNPTDRGITSTHINRGDNNWERLSDEDSDKGILVNGQNGIRADYTYSVELETYNSGTSRGPPQSASSERRQGSAMQDYMAIIIIIKGHPSR